LETGENFPLWSTEISLMFPKPVEKREDKLSGSSMANTGKCVAIGLYFALKAMGFHYVQKNRPKPYKVSV